MYGKNCARLRSDDYYLDCVELNLHGIFMFDEKNLEEIVREILELFFRVQSELFALVNILEERG